MIELDSINKSFREPDNSERVLFDGLQLSVPQAGGSIAIMGRSGSGKTTLLRILAGLDSRYTGTYRFMGEELPRRERALRSFRREHIGFVPQLCTLLDDRDVLANVELALGGARIRRQRAQECLELVGLSDFRRKHPDKLSGGEAQRVVIARALANNPDVLLTDEPTSALDEETERRIMRVLLDSANRRLLIITTHNPAIASLCDIRYTITGRHLERRSD